MSPPIRIAMLGFSEFERQTLGSFFRLTLDRKYRYEAVLQLADSDYIVADADHAATVQLVAATDRLSEALFIGIHPPAGALAWMKPSTFWRSPRCSVAVAHPRRRSKSLDRTR